MATFPAPQQANHPNRRDIQGNVVGFNKDHQRFVLLAFADQASGRAFLGELEPDLASAWEVLRFNELFKEIHTRRGGASDIEASWTNLCLTFAGLELLGAHGLEAFPEEFRQGMVARAAIIGDVEDSDPTNWRPHLHEGIHAMVILAADAREDLDRSYQHLQGKMQAHGVSELGHEDGNVREGQNRGREHFGFKDGISQPGIADITRSSKRGQDEIATGEFLIGYPDQDGNVSGQPVAAPQPDQPGYNPIAPPPPPAPIPVWAHDGSFVVFRRLRQNVQAFDDFIVQQAGVVGGNPELLGAKLVGRWRSGAPLERTRDQAADFDPAAGDPAVADPSILSDSKINNFDYDPQDADGHLVPRAAHIRKVNPRGGQPPGREDSNRHRILRRGVPYGPEFQPGEPPYPGGPSVPDDQDRGLLFVCYQSSLARGFEFIQSQWANRQDFPQPNDGRDPIIAQDVATRELTAPNIHLSMARWVQTTGGAYFFSPSLSAIRQLASQT
jgi:Dyp-type peroxidase family